LAESADIKLTPAGQDVATFAAPGFCERAVRIVRETGKPVAQVARDLGFMRGR